MEKGLNAASTVATQPSVRLDPINQQIFYTITNGDGMSQKYATALPKHFDQSAIIKTIATYVSKDPSQRKGTLKIHLPKNVTLSKKQPHPQESKKVATPPKKKFLNNEKKIIADPSFHEKSIDPLLTKNFGIDLAPSLDLVYNSSRGKT